MAFVRPTSPDGASSGYLPNHVNTLARAALLLSVAALSACASSTSAVIDTFRYGVTGKLDVARIPLNPNFRYLRVTIDGRTALVVLGYVENHPQGPIQVWYSAEREVLRLQNGRIVGAVGLPTEWRNVVVTELPTWAYAAQAGAPTRTVRLRDVMPGYRYGVKDTMVLKVVPPPARSALVELEPGSLTWFEESIETDALAVRRDDKLLPAARYAVALGNGEGTVVYGEQCLAPKLCFAWQQWPARPLPPSTPK